MIDKKHWSIKEREKYWLRKNHPEKKVVFGFQREVIESKEGKEALEDIQKVLSFLDIKIDVINFRIMSYNGDGTSTNKNGSLKQNRRMKVCDLIVEIGDRWIDRNKIEVNGEL